MIFGSGLVGNPAGFKTNPRPTNGGNPLMYRYRKIAFPAGMIDFISAGLFPVKTGQLSPPGVTSVTAFGATISLLFQARLGGAMSGVTF
jgi:hypothetical protein